MDHRQRGGVEERGDEVPIAGRVDAVGDDAREPESLSKLLHVDGIARAGNRPGSDRQFVGIDEERGEARVVALERRGVGEEEVRQQAPAGRGEGACRTASARRPEAAA